MSLCTLTALASDGSSTNTRVTSAITTLCVFMPVRPPGPEDARQYPLSLSLANQCSLLLSLFLQRFPPISLCLYLFIYLSIYLSSSLSVLCMDFSVRPSALFLCLSLSLGRSPLIPISSLSLRSLSTPFYLNPPTFALLSRHKAVDPTIAQSTRQLLLLSRCCCCLASLSSVAALPAFSLDIQYILEAKVSKL